MLLAKDRVHGVCDRQYFHRNVGLATCISMTRQKEHVVEAIANLLNVYIDLREDDERFIDTFRRLGITPFKDCVYTPAIEHEDVQRAAN
jgi:dissimilatory sulfite reductase (desulfoviridin) alpha/beta subunit|tara:strand:- start:357 stop:623 length:267 start_codon:yes stop_codon:yes gene_type:complete